MSLISLFQNNNWWFGWGGIIFYFFFIQMFITTNFHRSCCCRSSSSSIITLHFDESKNINITETKHDQNTDWFGSEKFFFPSYCGTSKQKPILFFCLVHINNPNNHHRCFVFIHWHMFSFLVGSFSKFVCCQYSKQSKCHGYISREKTRKQKKNMETKCQCWIYPEHDKIIVTIHLLI